MRMVKENNAIDAIADSQDIIDVRIESRVTGDVLYVDVNGMTVLRIGHIKQQVEVKENYTVKID